MDQNLAHKNSELLAVIMPVYNGAEFLREAVDSILSQSFTNFLLVIINDGSSDRSEEIILSFNDPRIVYQKNEKNLGIVATLNRGVQLSKAKYLARMDADDIAHPDRLKLQLEFLESHPDIDVCGTWVKVFGEYNEVWEMPVKNEEIRARLLFRNAICHPSVMYRKDIFVKNRTFYSDRFLHQEDYFLWWDLRNSVKFENLPFVLLNYRLQGQNLTAINRDTEKDRVVELFDTVLREFGLITDNELVTLHYFGFRQGYVHPDKRSIRKLKGHYDQIIRQNSRIGFVPPEIMHKEIKKRKQELFLPILRWGGVAAVLNYWVIFRSVKFNEVIRVIKYIFAR